MDKLNAILNGMDKTILGILITSLIGLICWIVKGLVEIPLNNSKETFFKHFEKRIELLADLQTRLSMIAYFPEQEGMEFKQEIQTILLKNGNAAYLSSDMLQNILKLAITPDTDETLLKKTINDINVDLSKHISKIEESNKFFLKYSSVDPIKRIVGYFLLATHYSLIFFVMIGVIFIMIYYFTFGTIYSKILSALIGVASTVLLSKWIKN